MATETPKQANPIKGSVQQLIDAVGQRALSSVTGKVGAVSGRLTDYAKGNGGLLSALTGAEKPVKAVAGAALSGTKNATGLAGKAVGKAVKNTAGKAMDKAKGALPGQGGSGDKLKVTNIVEGIDIGIPVSAAYDQWTRFTDFPTFMKKVQDVEQVSDTEVTWKARIFFSDRSWDTEIIEQVPDIRIVWRTTSDRLRVDGAVTFHEVTPDLTRVVLVLEYHPQGFFEKTANIWRAQGRRARLELKHFRRHAMTQTILRPEEVEGWRGEIHDGEVMDEEAPDEGAVAEEGTDEEATDEEATAAEEQEEPEPARPAGAGNRRPAGSRR